MIEYIGNGKFKVHWDIGISDYYIGIYEPNQVSTDIPYSAHALNIDNYKCKLYVSDGTFTNPINLYITENKEYSFPFQATKYNEYIRVFAYDTVFFRISNRSEVYDYLTYIGLYKKSNYTDGYVVGGKTTRWGTEGYNNIGGDDYRFQTIRVNANNYNLDLPTRIEYYLVNDFIFEVTDMPDNIEKIEIGIRKFNGETSTIDIYNQSKISLFMCDCENIIVDKTEYLTLKNDMFGEFRDSISITNPVVTIETDKDITQYNYCYIPKFRRYYYIEDIICERKNIYTLSCSVDSLMSFKEYILNQICIITRASKRYSMPLEKNTTIIDELLPLESVYTYNYKKDIISEELDMNGVFIVNLMTLEERTLNAPYTNNCHTYIMDRVCFNDFVSKYQTLSTSDLGDISQIIVSVGWAPVSIDYIYNFAIDRINRIFTIFNQEILLDKGICKILNNPIIPLFDNTINLDLVYPTNFDYLNKTSLIIEFYSTLTGFVKLDNYSIIDRTINITVFLDCLTSNATLIITSGDNVLFTSNIPIIYNIGVGRTNYSDIQRDLYSIEKDYVIGQVRIEKEVRSGVIETVAGAISGSVNPRKSLTSKIVEPIASGLEVASNALSDSAVNDLVRSKNSRIAQQPEYTVSRCIGNLYDITSFFNAYIRYSHQKIIWNKYEEFVGYAVNQRGQLRNYGGFTIANVVRLKNIPYALNSEKEQIKNYLQTGVILP